MIQGHLERERLETEFWSVLELLTRQTKFLLISALAYLVLASFLLKSNGGGGGSRTLTVSRLQPSSPEPRQRNLSEPRGRGGDGRSPGVFHTLHIPATALTPQPPSAGRGRGREILGKGRQQRARFGIERAGERNQRLKKPWPKTV